MSGDQLDLDALTARNTAARAALNDLALGYSDSPNALKVDWALADNRALVAEVRRLRAQVERVEDACHEWIDGADSDRFQRHVASQILAALDEP